MRAAVVHRLQTYLIFISGSFVGGIQKLLFLQDAEFRSHEKMKKKSSDLEFWVSVRSRRVLHNHAKLTVKKTKMASNNGSEHVPKKPFCVVGLTTWPYGRPFLAFAATCELFVRWRSEMLFEVNVTLISDEFKLKWLISDALKFWAWWGITPIFTTTHGGDL